MHPQARVGDSSSVPADAHGCPSCPHSCSGPATQGSPNVFVNTLPAVRVGDRGVHTSCCGENTWKAAGGSSSVFINRKATHRQGDKVMHCGGQGKTIEGSPNVFIGDARGGDHKPHNLSNQEPFEGGFTLLDHDDQPMENVSYVIRTQSGAEYFGRTDKQGHTRLVLTDREEELDIEIIDDDDSCGS